MTGYTSAGLAGSEEMARFLWDSGIAAVACDNPAVEVVPADPADGFLHGRLIPGLGMAIGELFSFGALAAACAAGGAVRVPVRVRAAQRDRGDRLARQRGRGLVVHAAARFSSV